MRAAERPADEGGRVVLQAYVVERDLERPLGPVEERAESAGDVDRGLPTVRECVELDQGCLAVSDALYARFCACRATRRAKVG